MEAKNEKICPFCKEPCMKKDCMMFDDEVGQCEFKDLSKFIGECVNDLIKTIEELKDD